MPKTRTFVLLHAGSGWFKQVYAGTKTGRVQQVTNSYRRCGWAGNIHVVRAQTLKEAVEKAGKKLYG